MPPRTDRTRSLRDQLLASEPVNPALRADYERKVQAMFEIQLTQTRKIFLVALTLVSTAMGVLILTLALTERLPLVPKIGMFVGVCFAAAWVVYFVSVLRRGTFRLRVDPPRAAAMAYVFALLMCVLFAVAGMPADLVVLNGMLFLLPAGLMLISTMVSQAEMRTQERLLHLEYKLARLNRKLGAGDDDDDDDDDTLSSGVLR